jgi:coiled-coil domain-containing protein 130
MMFDVRCLGCKKSIGKGVRFNAKKKAGNYLFFVANNVIVDTYLSTKIYEFTMNCHYCGNKLALRTDPKNTDYILYSGLEKRVN